jgi:hypothetical protein
VEGGADAEREATGASEWIEDEAIISIEAQ